MKVKTNEEIKEFCVPFGDNLGIKVVDVEFKQGKNPSLTIFIDKDGGVDLDACESFHNAIFDPLDELDPTYGEPYTLNVSSLGVDRPFKTDEDFLSHIGKRVEVKVPTSIKGKKIIDGVLTKYDGKSIVLKTDGESLSLELKKLIKVNEYIDF